MFVIVIPAKAGIQGPWVPAFAGTTEAGRGGLSDSGDVG